MKDDLEESSIILSENLVVGKTKVISIAKGEGQVRDEGINGSKQS